MKKIYTFFVLVVIAVASCNLFAQGFYTGASQLPGYSNTPQHQVQGQPQHDNGIQICQPCAIPEGEPDIPNNGTDVTDGGCNFSPNLFKTINFGDVFCGRCNGYLVGTPPDTAQWRDTDWYKLVLTTPTTVCFSCYSNFYIIMDVQAEDCQNFVVPYVFKYLNPYVSGSWSGTLGPGTYDLVVLPQTFGTTPGNTGDYMVKLSTSDPGDPSTWCTPVCIPTLSQWGLIILGMVLMVVATVYIVRRGV